QYSPPIATEDLSPAVLEHAEFASTSDQRCQTGVAESLEAGACFALLKNLVDLECGRNTFQRRSAQRPAAEEARHESMRQWTDHQRVRRGNALQAGGDVRGVAEGHQFVALRAHHFTDHDLTGVAAEPDGQLDTVSLPEFGVEGANGLGDTEAGPHGALRVVLVGVWVTE